MCSEFSKIFFLFRRLNQLPGVPLQRSGIGKFIFLYERDKLVVIGIGYMKLLKIGRLFVLCAITGGILENQPRIDKSRRDSPEVSIFNENIRIKTASVINDPAIFRLERSTSASQQIGLQFHHLFDEYNRAPECICH